MANLILMFVNCMAYGTYKNLTINRKYLLMFKKTKTKFTIEMICFSLLSCHWVTQILSLMANRNANCKERGKYFTQLTAYQFKVGPGGKMWS
jgi:hypothetical protein